MGNTYMTHLVLSQICFWWCREAKHSKQAVGVFCKQNTLDLDSTVF